MFNETHDSAHAEARRAASQVGSRTPRAFNALQKVIDKSVGPDRLDIVPVLMRVAVGVWKHEVSPQVGTSIAALLGQVIKAHSIRELEDRIAAVEKLRPDDVIISEVPVWTGPSELIVSDGIPSAGSADSSESAEGEDDAEVG